MLGLMRESTHFRILSERENLLQRISNDLMDDYTSRCDMMLLRQRQAHEAEVRRLRALVVKAQGRQA
jgi:hypothetical protein